MAAKRPQTTAKRARELAVKERRERKRAKKADATARRAADEQAAETPAQTDRQAPGHGASEATSPVEGMPIDKHAHR